MRFGRFIQGLTLSAVASSAACTNGADKDGDTDTSDTSVEDTSDSGDTSADSGDTSDTGMVDSAFDTDALCPGYDTADPFLMPALGPTPLDGEWIGRFRVREEYPNGAPWRGLTPVCEGNMSMTVDGCGGVHLFGLAECTDWDPNMIASTIPGIPWFPSVTTPYGPIGGFVQGELDPTDYTKASLELQINWTGDLFPWVGTNGMGPVVPVEVVDGIKMIVDYRSFAIPIVNVVPKEFDMVLCKVGAACDAVLPELPVDTDPPDSGDTDETDSGDTGDSGETDDTDTVDSGDSGDTDETDTGSVDTADSGDTADSDSDSDSDSGT